MRGKRKRKLIDVIFFSVVVLYFLCTGDEATGTDVQFCSVIAVAVAAEVDIFGVKIVIRQSMDEVGLEGVGDVKMAAAEMFVIGNVGVTGWSYM